MDLKESTKNSVTNVVVEEESVKLAKKERQTRKRKMIEMNPYYIAAKKIELEKSDSPTQHTENMKVKRRLGDDFRDVDDMHTALYYFENEMRKVIPYYFEYKSFAKGRWLGRTLFDVFSDEFRDRSHVYYRYAIEKGLLTINDEQVTVDTVVKNNDVIGHKIHRHEPPVTDQPIKIVFEDDDLMVVDKPGGIPVHPTGRYRHNTIVHVLKKDRNIPKLFPCNRLDLPTSGLMFIAKNSTRAKKAEREMTNRLIRKQYVCRVDGKFPDGDIVCDAPIKCISHKMSVNYVHKDGKQSSTEFKRLSYNGKTSVVCCKPLTGRTHQIRVHLRYLGYPISNDPLYGNHTTWAPFIRPGERMVEEDARLLVDKLFEYSPMDDWKPEETIVSKDGLEKDDTKCSECSASLILGRNYDQLCIYLHAWKYSCDDWAYETELPFWAKEDYEDKDAPLKFTNTFLNKTE